MEQKKRTQQLLLSHYQSYPRAEIRDLFKYLYQSAFGCEHMVSSSEAAIEGIRRELRTAPPHEEPYTEPLDGEYSRVHLACLKDGLSAETLGKLFYASARSEPKGKKELEDKLATAKELVGKAVFPFSSNEFDQAADEWRMAGYPALRHSETFRSHYNPAYRVVANRYIPFLPLFAKIDPLLEKGPAVVAIEGSSASGKSTLGEMLAEIYGCTVFHMDDFFLRPEQRTAARYAEPGGNVDRERFLEEVLRPLSKRDPVDYRRFDCATQKIAPPVRILPQKLTVIEGAYSMHPDLAGYHDLSVFLDISPELQKARIEKRNDPQTAQRFHHEWIPLEHLYFDRLNVKERCDLTIPIQK